MMQIWLLFFKGVETTNLSCISNSEIKTLHMKMLRAHFARWIHDGSFKVGREALGQKWCFRCVWAFRRCEDRRARHFDRSSWLQWRQWRWFLRLLSHLLQHPCGWMICCNKPRQRQLLASAGKMSQDTSQMKSCAQFVMSDGWNYHILEGLCWFGSSDGGESKDEGEACREAYDLQRWLLSNWPYNLDSSTLTACSDFKLLHSKMLWMNCSKNNIPFCCFSVWRAAASIAAIQRPREGLEIAIQLARGEHSGHLSLGSANCWQINSCRFRLFENWIWKIFTHPLAKC